MQDVTKDIDRGHPLADGLVKAWVELGYETALETYTTEDGQERTRIRVRPLDGGGGPVPCEFRLERT